MRQRHFVLVPVSTLLMIAACDGIPSPHGDPVIGLQQADAQTSAAGDAGAAPATDVAPPLSEPASDAGSNATGLWLEVCGASTLNMRSGPGTSYSVIGELPEGAAVRVLMVDGDWMQVEYGELVGWCHSKYLCSLPGSVDASPGGSDAGAPPPPSGSPGPAIGQVWNTYYYLALEDDYDGAKDTVLYDAQCQPLATVAAAYADTVCIEGSGKLSSGELINYAKTCSCGRPCPTGGTVCYKKLPPSFPWGEGAASNPLAPLRSLAVDKSRIALGTTVYLASFDGLAIPSVDGIGGFVHDGCFSADDVGGAIQGLHVDIFAGTASMWKALEPLVPTQSSIDAREGGERCAHLE